MTQQAQTPKPVNTGTRLICPSCGHALNIVVRQPGGLRMCFLHPEAVLERREVFAPLRSGHNRLSKVKGDVKLSRAALDSLFVDSPDFVSLAQNLAQRLITAGTILQDLANEPRDGGL